ncbi:LysR family transcriptional regulator, partial [Klebsiella pneumoniae]
APDVVPAVCPARPRLYGRATPLHLIVKRDLAPIDEQVATLLALFRTP